MQSNRRDDNQNSYFKSFSTKEINEFVLKSNRSKSNLADQVTTGRGPNMVSGMPVGHADLAYKTSFHFI
jgi:hypothetical protein